MNKTVAIDVLRDLKDYVNENLDEVEYKKEDPILEALSKDVEELKKSAYENKNFERLAAFKQCQDIICKYTNVHHWIPVENAEQLIMKKEEKYSSTKSGSTYDMHLYQAIASYDLESELKFLISEVEIDEITDDCVILTKYFQPVSECAVSNRFAGCDALNTNKEFRISKHTYVMYSTWRPKCVRFLLEHLRQAKAKLCIMDDMICKYIEKFQKEYENANV